MKGSEVMMKKKIVYVKRANGYRNRERLKRDLYFHLGGLNLYPAIPL